MNKKYPVILTDAERDELLTLIRAGTAPARKLLHTRILLKVDQYPHGPAWVDDRIGDAVEISQPTVAHLRRVNQTVEQGDQACPSRGTGWGKRALSSAWPLICAAELELDLDPPVGYRTSTGSQVLQHRGQADITPGNRSQEPFRDPATLPRSSSGPQQPAPVSPRATSGPHPQDAPSSRPIAALPTRAAQASR